MVKNRLWAIGDRFEVLPLIPYALRLTLFLLEPLNP